jgi:hypothetical protein
MTESIVIVIILIFSCSCFNSREPDRRSEPVRKRKFQKNAHQTINQRYRYRLKHWINFLW